MMENPNLTMVVMMGISDDTILVLVSFLKSCLSLCYYMRKMINFEYNNCLDRFRRSWDPKGHFGHL